jgi:putative Mg2+ transporter-C (MgtC) family protein
MVRFIHLLDPNMDLAQFVSNTILRLLLACFLGGAIGLEREIKHKPAGLRTNMFICFGCAMFTILSFRFSANIADKTRIAAQIITGIGFIGAGSIMHSKGAVSGLTTAATMFVVASIGMAVGGGEYLTAIFATMVILVALSVLGSLEFHFRNRAVALCYEVVGKDLQKSMSEVNRILTESHLSTRAVKMDTDRGFHRIQFTVGADPKVHTALMDTLRKCSELERVELVPDSDTDS